MKLAALEHELVLVNGSDLKRNPQNCSKQSVIATALKLPWLSWTVDTWTYLSLTPVPTCFSVLP